MLYRYKCLGPSSAGGDRAESGSWVLWLPGSAVLGCLADFSLRAVAWHEEWTQGIWNPRAGSFWQKEMRVFRIDPGPYPRAAFPSGWRLSQRPPLLSGPRVNTGARVSSSSTSVPCSPPPQKTTWKPSSWEMRPAATASSSSPRQCGRRQPWGQDLLLQSPAANQETPGCGEGPSRVGQQGGTGWLFEVIPGPG